MMLDYKYPPVLSFPYQFDYDRLLSDFYDLDEKGYTKRLLATSPDHIVFSESEATYCRNDLLNLTKDMIREHSARRILRDVRQFCKRFTIADYSSHFVRYKPNDFVLWHKDQRPVGIDESTTAINIMLTGESYTTFRDKNYYYVNGLVDVTRREHMYDNINKSEKVILRIQIKDYNYDSMYEIMEDGHTYIPCY